MRVDRRALLCAAALTLLACGAERAGGPVARAAPVPTLDLAAVDPATLVVLDGVALPPGSPKRRLSIAGDRVASVELLRGPTAVARFGREASGGAVVITTAP